MVWSSWLLHVSLLNIVSTVLSFFWCLLVSCLHACRAECFCGHRVARSQLSNSRNQVLCLNVDIEQEILLMLLFRDIASKFNRWGFSILYFLRLCFIYLFVTRYLVVVSCETVLTHRVEPQLIAVNSRLWLMISQRNSPGCLYWSGWECVCVCLVLWKRCTQAECGWVYVWSITPCVTSANKLR